jgi:hypothetical protein
LKNEHGCIDNGCTATDAAAATAGTVSKTRRRENHQRALQGLPGVCSPRYLTVGCLFLI